MSVVIWKDIAITRRETARLVAGIAILQKFDLGRELDVERKFFDKLLLFEKN